MTSRGSVLASACGALALTALLLLAPPLTATGASGPSDTAVTRPPAEAVTPGPAACEAAPPAQDSLVSVDPAAESSSPGGVDRGGRTCRCSCGFPCKSDADCGGAIGSCRGGISCC